MKKLFNIVLLLVFVAFMPLICACVIEDWRSQPYPVLLEVFVDFQHEGIPLADSLKLYDVEAEAPMMFKDIIDENDIKVSVIRESDNKKLFNLVGGVLSWIYINNESSFFDDYNISDKRPRTLLRLMTDTGEYVGSNKKKKHEETYLIILKSEKLFSDNKEHTIRITGTLYGKWTFEPTRLEQDGKEVEIMPSRYYSGHNRFESYIKWDV